MPVPSAITDLSQTAGSNSPSGSESPITTDNYLRAHASYIALTNAALGSGTVAGFTQSGTGAATRTFQNKVREFLSVKDFGATGDGVTNDRAACQAAIDAVIAAGGGIVYFPPGNYLIQSTASSDTTNNGLLIPLGDINAFPMNEGVTLSGDYGASFLLAGSNSMMLIRSARQHTTIKDLSLEGNSKTGCTAIGLVPESMTQTTTLGSQGYALVHRVSVNGFDIGLRMQPGPTVTGTDSGGFYHTVSETLFNQNNLHVWLAADSTAGNNRTTRTKFTNCTIARGNTGVLIDKGTEIDFFGCNFEHFTAAYAGGSTSPSATPTAFNYADTNSGNIRLFGGYAEDCTISITAAEPESVMLVGFNHTGSTDSSEANMYRVHKSRINVARDVAGQSPFISFVNSDYVSIIADPDVDGSKTIAVYTNGVERTRWFNGITTHQGSTSDVIMDAAGITYPGTDNAVALGKSTNRYSEAFATILRPGAGTVTWTSGSGTPEGSVTAAIGSLYTRTNGGASTTLYVKESGVGNTGWVAK